ncbi:conserved hypothetical protein [Pediculus humanus corporis]|uniref:Activator of Hsp90 ATPase AHSA1-like N-terminal domain-containing protein n=1 Tax=Pediculus humanus subsp. corporis TaxID=121224 RepID=E0VNP2_PEDHC|nr:uncharacterized protein Phum_PHUM338940 [Pediculus humanus corporis]EEB14998.1 conserved hypothetical protein [Pediculus humanus corporis]
MAKWGEGDPRWIVEERPDAINVNNWHWTEKNACGWSQSKFKELFKDLKIENDAIKCKITEIDKCNGEAVANNRKGKLIFFYEWDITLNWKGKLTSDGEKSVTGTIHIPNLSEENEIHEVDVMFTVNDSSLEATTVKDILKECGTPIIRDKLSKYVQGLKVEFSQGMILPRKDSDEKTKDSINNVTSGHDTKVQVKNSISNSELNSSAKNNEFVKNDGNNVNTTKLKMTRNFQCTGEELYRALTCYDLVVAFTHGPVKLDLQKGGEFELFGGYVHGKFIEIVPNLKLIQSWRLKRWPEGHYSTVTIEIRQKQDHTELEVLQTGVPAGEADATTENWERYYWDALKRTFGFGYFL